MRIWADPIAAFTIAVIAVRQGREGWLAIPAARPLPPMTLAPACGLGLIDIGSVSMAVDTGCRRRPLQSELAA